MKKATMRDVAREAGVSVMTVSYALRHHPSIPEATAERIREIARTLGYKTNPLVSAFISQVRHGKTMKTPPSIGYINMRGHLREQSSASPHYASFHYTRYRGAKARCKELGFGFGLIEPMISGMSGKRLNDVLLYNNYCGLILTDIPTSGRSLDIDWSLFSVASLEYTTPRSPFHSVGIDHFQSLGAGLQQLTDLGYRRIAVATFHLSSQNLGDRYIAATAAFQRRLPPSQRVPLLIGCHSEMTATRLRRWLDRHRPDALIDAGQGRYRLLLQEAGVEIPCDLAYATSNWKESDTDIAGLWQHPFRVGAAAVDVVVKQIYANQRGYPANITKTLVEASWVNGATAPPVK